MILFYMFSDMLRSVMPGHKPKLPDPAIETNKLLVNKYDQMILKQQAKVDRMLAEEADDPFPTIKAMRDLDMLKTHRMASSYAMMDAWAREPGR